MTTIQPGDCKTDLVTTNTDTEVRNTPVSRRFCTFTKLKKQLPRQARDESENETQRNVLLGWIQACAAMGVTPGKIVGEGWANEWQLLQPADVAGAVIYAATAPPHVAVNEILIEPRDQA